MKTATSHPSHNVLGESSRRDWARQVLDIPADASVDAARQELLSRLEDFDFMPPPHVRQAIRIVSARPLEATSTVPSENAADPFAEQIESRLHDEVEEFARTYFETGCGERRRRWTELTSKARPFPRLRIRLAPLQAGLDVEIAVPQNDPRAEILARRVTMLYVLPPAQQEPVRQQWLREMKNSGRWKNDVRKFRARYSPLAKLEPDLLATLEILETDRTLPEPSKTIAPLAGVKPRAKFTSSPVRKNSSSGSRVPIALVLVACSVLANIGRYAVNSSNQQPWSAPNNYVSPSSSRRDASEANDKYLHDLMRAQQSFGENNNAGTSAAENPADPAAGAAEIGSSSAGDAGAESGNRPASPSPPRDGEP